MTGDQPPPCPAKIIAGRYELFDQIASGGMASVHLGRQVGVRGFAKTVAIKRMHGQFARDPKFVAMFLDEARVVTRIRHPNVVSTLDLIEQQGELFIVMEFVDGEVFSRLIRGAYRRKETVPVGITLRIMSGVLLGLHAAHEAKSAQGKPLNLVHRDVSPENVLVGVDGFTRLLDFGVARALDQYHSSIPGQVKGKLGYMSPEEVLGNEVNRRSDVFSTSVVLWQALTGRRLFDCRDVKKFTMELLHSRITPPSELSPHVPKKFDDIVLRGLERDPEDRWSSALKMADAIEAVGSLASRREVGTWVKRGARVHLEKMAVKVKAIESAAPTLTPASGIIDSASGVQISVPDAPASAPQSTSGRGAQEIDSAQSVASHRNAGAPNKASRWKIAFGVLASVSVGGILALVVNAARFSDKEATAASSSPAKPTSTSITQAAKDDPVVTAVSTAAHASSTTEPSASASATATASSSSKPKVASKSKTTTRPRSVKTPKPGTKRPTPKSLYKQY